MIKIMDLFTNFSPQFLGTGAFWYLAVFVTSFLESVVIIGLAVPGTVFLLFLGFLLTKGFLNITLIMIMAFLGAILGDIVSFILGKKGTKLFKKGNKILKIANLEKGRDFINKHGGKSIFFGRFTGPIRSIVPFIAGTFGMNYRTFLFWNILSGISWVILYLFLGFSFGEAWRVVEIYSDRAEIVIAALILFLAIFYFVKLYFSSKEVKVSTKILNFLIDFFEETIFKIRFFRKYSKFIIARFKKNNFFGLPLTLLSIAFIYVLLSFFRFAKNLVFSGAIHGLDIRIENLLYVFRDEDLIKFFYWITLLANWQIIVSFGVILSIIFWIYKKKDYIYTLWISVVGAQLFDSLGKIAYGRPRPQSAIFVESTNSFPSGHSAMAIAFYGFIAYVLLRTREGKKKKINIFSTAFLLIFFIGFSRMYLGLHYFSDIIGGYLLGFLWLIIAISIFEWSTYKRKQKNLPKHFLTTKNKKIVICLLLLEVIFYIVFALNYQRSFLFKPKTEKRILVNNVLLEYEKVNVPKYSETLKGSKQEPMSFLIVAKNDSELIRLLEKSGWLKADYFNRNSVSRMVVTAFLNQSYPTNVITPSFWNAKVHDYGFQKPTAKNNISERHHVRFWKTNVYTKDGKVLYLGTASFDIGIKWLITHEIDPNIDAEREFLFKDILSSGMIKNYQKIQFVDKTQGKNFTGDSFYTDGKAYFIELK